MTSGRKVSWSRRMNRGRWPFIGVICLYAAFCGCQPEPVDDAPAVEPEIEQVVTAEPARSQPDAQQPMAPVPVTSAPVTPKPVTPTPSEPIDIAPLPGLNEQADGPADDSSIDLKQALDELQVPPDWFAEIQYDYDTSKPWEDARLEIRRLLALGGDEARRGVKLTYAYRLKDDMNDGHEYPTYMFLGGERVWAVQAYREFIDGLLADPESHTHVGAFFSLASLYTHFGEYDQAEATIDQASGRLPEPPWRIARQAELQDAYGDLYAAMGDLPRATGCYAESIRLYPLSNQPYGTHLLQRRAAKVQSKMELLDKAALKDATFRDGEWKVRALGYSEDLNLTVVIAGGRIDDIRVQHQEKIDLGATQIVPQRIIDQQELDVDGITGATVTSDAIIDGVYQALKKARE